MALILDIETNGFLRDVTKTHCIVLRNTITRETFRCTNDDPSVADMTIEESLRYIMASSDPVVFHNGISYDYPVLQKLYPWFVIAKSRCIDTLVLTRLIFSHVKETDTKLLKKGKLPGKMFGSHSLEAWGYRLGKMKGEYASEFKAEYIEAWGADAWVDGMEWKEYSREMLEYCVQDVEVTEELWNLCNNQNYSQEAIDLEHEVMWLMAQMMRNGWPFNDRKGADLYVKLVEIRVGLEAKLKEYFGSWTVKLPDFIPKRDNKTKGFLAGVPVPRYKLVEFNPGSRDHIADRLTTLYGWNPIEFTEGGKPKVDEVVLAGLDYEPIPLLTEYLLVSKRISQLAEGDYAWLKLSNNGMIYGSINPNGAVTGRATHSYPNVSQVPSSTSPYGHECRELFEVPPGWTLVGADASGLELRCLAHFMARYDGGAYAVILLEGDIHTTNQKAAGLPDRPSAKTFIYAFLYGAGDEKIGSIVKGTAQHGAMLKRKFLKSLPALDKLIMAVKLKAKSKFLTGLDGRQLFVRSSHAALNTLLQSAGALACKKWLVLLDAELQAAGLKHGWDGDYCLLGWIHDEVQIACRTPEIAATVAELAPKCVTKAGEHFKFRCPLNGEAKIGKNWAETH